MILKTVQFLLAVLLLASGCAHYPVNAPLSRAGSRAGYRFQNAAPQTNSDDVLLMLAFSGGGREPPRFLIVCSKHSRTRKWAFRTTSTRSWTMWSHFLGFRRQPTAAYYALWGDRIFSDFEPCFLKKRVQTGCFFGRWRLGTKSGWPPRNSAGATWRRNIMIATCSKARPLGI